MYEYFDKKVVARSGINKFPAFNTLYAKLTEQKLKVIDYYRDYPKYMPSNHYLARLLESITVGFDDPIHIHARKVSEIMPRLAGAFNLTTSTNKAEAFKGNIFLHYGSREIIVGVDDHWDYITTRNDWMNWQPIRYLHHDLTDLSMPLLYGGHSTYSGDINEFNFNVIQINIPMLSAQYQCWRRHTANSRAGTHATIQQFLKSYPIANGLHSYLDYAILNRLQIISKGLVNSPFKNSHNFQVTSMDASLDIALRDVWGALIDKKYDFQTMLRAIPAVYTENMWDALAVPDVANTRQIQWALNIARMPAISFVLRAGSVNDKNGNTGPKTIIKRTLQDIKNDGGFASSLHPMARHQLKEYIIKNIIKYL